MSKTNTNTFAVLIIGILLLVSSLLVVVPAFAPVPPKKVDTCPKPPVNATFERSWNCGVWKYDHGGIRRVFHMYVSEQYNYDVDGNGTSLFNGWSFNKTIPGPTLRMTEGDAVTVYIHNTNNPHFAHNFHMHSIHKSIFDAAGFHPEIHLIKQGTTGQYIFTAQPFGVYPYHCHVTPVDLHISKGLYGVMIIDPKQPREPADEIVLMSSAFDTDGDKINDYYVYNGVINQYAEHPIQVKANQTIRIYLVNMVEYRDVISWHIHGNMFYYWASGTNSSRIYTDIVTLAQGDRGVLEMKFPYLNTFLFHSHQNDVMEKGQMGFFDVKA